MVEKQNKPEDEKNPIYENAEEKWPLANREQSIRIFLLVIGVIVLVAVVLALL